MKPGILILLSGLLLSQAKAESTHTITFGEFSSRALASQARNHLNGICPAGLQVIETGEGDNIRFRLETRPEAGRTDCFERIRKMAPRASIEPLRPSPQKPGSGTVVVTSPSKQAKPSRFVPPGFEDLMEPQTTEVDVFFGGVFLTSTLATYTPVELTFLQPEEVVERIPDLLEPPVILDALSSALPTNSEFACLKTTQTGCGRISTDHVEIIFNENEFRVDLFVGPDLLAVRDTDIDKYLPASSAGLSLMHQISAAYSGTGKSNGNFSIGQSTTLAYRETRLLALSNINDGEDFTIDTLALEREIAGRLYQGGIFRSIPANLVFVNQRDFAGVTFGSSLDTRKDLDQSAGNDLQLYLDSRSRVDILKDGRIVSTRIYDPGNQILDTSALPGGAYDVVLRIRDSFGRIREETRFYVKTNDIPPMDHTLYFFDFGEVVRKKDNRVLPAGTGESILRTGISKRISTRFGGQLGAMKQGDDAVFEAGIFNLGRIYDLNLSLAAGNNHDRGASLSARVRAGRTTLNVYLRRTWISRDTGSLMGQESIQGNLNLSFPLGRGLVSLTGRYNDQLTRIDRNTGLRYDFPTRVVGRSLFDVELQITRDNGSLLVLFGARLTMNRGRWRNEISSQYYYDDPQDNASDSGLISNLGATWNDGDKYISDVTWNFRAVDEQEDRNLESDLEILSDRGRLNLDTSYSARTDRIDYGALFNTTLIANRGNFSMGGRTQARSALVMDIRGDVEDAYFNVEVNGAVRGSARIGEKTVIGVQPYETYEVSLVPQGEAIVDFTDQVQTVTVYPGNVVTLRFEAKRVFVVFGQIVDENGDPVSNALIKGVTGLAITDETGFFQAEMESSSRELQVQTRSSRCSVSLPDYGSEDLIVSFGELVCR